MQSEAHITTFSMRAQPGVEVHSGWKWHPLCPSPVELASHAVTANVYASCKNHRLYSSVFPALSHELVMVKTLLYSHVKKLNNE